MIPFDDIIMIQILPHDHNVRDELWLANMYEYFGGMYLGHGLEIAPWDALTYP